MMLLLCLQQCNNIKSPFHHCLAYVAFYYFFTPLSFRVFQGLITRSKIVVFIVVIESSETLSINMSQQGINRNNKEKHL